eukprot:CAMPEP_0204634876 /NCGR_PEP_ID=MMETSP0717-20131115/30273_1 /ASSEMBLY_ACC=CAM_ASM_000666 /TAXON_ID=230516 /ORGANISM="Chaetoceros curvisetus" /LENGTH=305 /DNA_ID=CAMNT_0051653449 /DNA_START=60 /DNA_END=974 /DNA_ORIENTATION=-
MRMLQVGLLILPLIYAKLFPKQDEEDATGSSGKNGYLFGGDEPSLAGSDLSLDSPKRSLYSPLGSPRSISHFNFDDCSIEESTIDEASRVELCGLLGPTVPIDDNDIDPERFLTLPENLRDKVIIDLPVGYHRTRRAFLTSSSNFWTDSILIKALGYDDVNCTGWDRHDEIIGLPDHPDGVNMKEFIGATKTTSYVMPAGKLVGSSVATETTTLSDYTDDFFVIQMKTSTPGVPFGKKFLAKTQIIVVNLGHNQCQMICSVEPEFPHGPPLGMKGQITKGMKAGTMEMFEKIGSHIKNCATSYGW